MDVMDLISALGTVLDTPGAMVRTGLAGENPLSAVFDTDKRVSGRQLLERYGLAGKNEDQGWIPDAGDLGGFVAEMVLDPTNLVGGGLLARLMGKAGKAKAANLAIEAANENAAAINRATARAPRMVHPKLASDVIDDAAEAAEKLFSPPLSSTVRGYLPDLSNEKYHGAKQRAFSEQEIKSINGPSWQYRPDSMVPLSHENPRAPYWWNPYMQRKDYDELAWPTEHEIQIRYNDPEAAYIDAFKGLNGGHALKQAAIQNPEAIEVRLLRQLPKKLKERDVELLLASPRVSDFEKGMEILERNRTDRTIGAYAFPEEAEVSFMPLDRVENSAIATKNGNQDLIPLGPDYAAYQSMRPTQELPQLRPLLSALLGHNALARPEWEAK